MTFPSSHGHTTLQTWIIFFRMCLNVMSCEIGSTVCGTWSWPADPVIEERKGSSLRCRSFVFLTDLHKRNNFLIDSHHPLQDTLRLQTGKTEPDRRRFLQQAYRQSKELLTNTWKPECEHERAF